MRLPIEWILEHAPVEAAPSDIANALTMAGLEVEAADETEYGTVLEIKVTPNRGDCLSVVGVARELAAAYRTELLPGPDVASSEDEPPDAAAYTGVEIEDADLCPRYAARIVEGVRHCQSPDWMQRRLIASGMRPINAVVDITNYVMLETGQPLHAFDYDTLIERRIVVRRARDGEELETLDGAVRALDGEALVIADARRPVALAGIMGGAATEITETTSTLLLESAHFDWRSVRRTARRLNLGTEASYRFERTVDPEGVVAAADRACALMAELGVGNPVPGVVDMFPGKRPPRALTLRTDRASMLLGFDLDPEDAFDALIRLGCRVERNDRTQFKVTVPSWRPDLVREVDLVEEVGRVVGYDSIPERLPSGVTTLGKDTERACFLDELRTALVGAGLQEVIGHSLMAESAFDDPATADKRIRIRTALSDELSGLRRSIVPGLLDALDRNARRGQGPLALFEIGNVFLGAGPSQHDERPSLAAVVCGPLTGRSWHANPGVVSPLFTMRGMADLIGSVVGLTMSVGPCSDQRCHPGRRGALIANGQTVGVAGELHPDLAKLLHVRERIGLMEVDCALLLSLRSETPTFVPPSAFPAISRDVAPRVPKDVPYSEIREQVCEAAGALLEDVALVDVYAGDRLPEGLRSLTLSLTLRSDSRTLTEDDAEQVLAVVRERLRHRFGASFPGE